MKQLISMWKASLFVAVVAAMTGCAHTREVKWHATFGESWQTNSLQAVFLDFDIPRGSSKFVMGTAKVFDDFLLTSQEESTLFVSWPKDFDMAEAVADVSVQSFTPDMLTDVSTNLVGRLKFSNSLDPLGLFSLPILSRGIWSAPCSDMDVVRTRMGKCIATYLIYKCKLPGLARVTQKSEESLCMPFLVRRFECHYVSRRTYDFFLSNESKPFCTLVIDYPNRHSVYGDHEILLRLFKMMKSHKVKADRISGVVRIDGADVKVVVSDAPGKARQK